MRQRPSRHVLSWTLVRTNFTWTDYDNVHIFTVIHDHQNIGGHITYSVLGLFSGDMMQNTLFYIAFNIMAGIKMAAMASRGCFCGGSISDNVQGPELYKWERRKQCAEEHRGHRLCPVRRWRHTEGRGTWSKTYFSFSSSFSELHPFNKFPSPLLKLSHKVIHFSNSDSPNWFVFASVDQLSLYKALGPQISALE